MSPIPKTFQDQFLGLDFSYSKTTLALYDVMYQSPLWLQAIVKLCCHLADFHPYVLTNKKVLVQFPCNIKLDVSRPLSFNVQLHLNFMIFCVSTISYWPTDLSLLECISCPCGYITEWVNAPPSSIHNDHTMPLHITRISNGLSFRWELLTMQKSVFCQFLFQWIYYCHSSKSTGK